MPLRLQTVALRIASIRGIQRAEKTNQRHGVLRDLIAGVPFSMVAAGGDAETTRVSAAAVCQKAVEFVVVVRMLPWPIIVIDLAAVQQIARAQLLRYAENDAAKSVHAAFDDEEVLRQRLEKLEVR